jgi:hypothetical protein
MSLPTLPKVQKLQDTLHAKAKGSPEFRFYALYDKVYRDDVLWVAYRRCLINGGAAGVDGETFEDIEQYGVPKWLGELAATPADGFASGYARSTRYRVRARHASRTNTCTASWG